jgi:hypothetical protein
MVAAMMFWSEGSAGMSFSRSPAYREAAYQLCFDIVTGDILVLHR